MDLYVASTFANPWPLALVVKLLEEACQLHLALRPFITPFVTRIYQILKEHSIREGQASANMVLVSKSTYPDETTPILALVVEVHLWRQAPDE